MTRRNSLQKPVSNRPWRPLLVGVLGCFAALAQVTEEQLRAEVEALTKFDPARPYGI